MLYHYLITFVFDAAILLAWPLALYEFMFEMNGFDAIKAMFEYLPFLEAVKTFGFALLNVWKRYCFKTCERNIKVLLLKT